MSLASFVVLAASVALAAAQGVQINTPTSVQSCLPIQLAWQGGAPPYYVTLIPGGQPGGTTVKDFGQQTGTNLVWNVDQPAGTSLTVQIRDANGNLNYSDKFQVQPSSQTCATGTSTSTSPTTTGTAAASPPKTGNTTAPSTGSTSSNTPTTSPGSTSKPSNSTPTTTTTTSSTPATANTAGSSSTPASDQAKSGASRVSSGLLAVGLSAAIALFA